MNAPIALRSHLSVVGYLVVSLAVLGSALLAQAQGLAALQDLIHPGLGSPVYSVSQLWAELGRTPQEWAGRTVLVRGQIVGARRFSDALDRMIIMGPPSLATVSPLQPGRSLPLDLGAADTLLARLRQVPLLGRVLPRPQALNWDRVAVYRIEVQAAPCPDRHESVCYRGLVVDANPRQ